MILERYTVFDELAEYDPVKKSITKFSRQAKSEWVPSLISGHFDYIGPKLVLLFRLNDVLYFEIDGQRMTMHDHAIDLRSVIGHRALRVVRDNRIVLEWTYAAPVIDPPLAVDPTPFVEEEHFDFGLFLANVSQDRSRQANLYAGS